MYEDIPPSGMRVRVHGVAVDVCADESNGLGKRVTDHAAYYDEASLRMQLTASSGEPRGRDAIRARATHRTHTQGLQPRTRAVL